ncbi:MAG TPA: VWA domain-containing protein [Opitutaceae bacterium]|nr:VWA domain-containing protein [Opitutaceae bacterium]
MRSLRFLSAALALASVIASALLVRAEPAAPATIERGRPLEFTLTPEAPELEFTFAHDASRLVGLRFASADPAAEFVLYAAAESAFGEYRIGSSLQWEYRGKRALSQLLDLLPQFPTTWRLKLTFDGDAARTFTVAVEDQGAAPAIRWAEPVGTLVVRNVGQTALTARPEPEAELSHPLFNDTEASPDLTPQGDAVFRLPAGLWTLHSTPAADAKTAANSLQSALIPVSSGGETIVTWPQMRALEGEQLRGLNELQLREASADGPLGRVLIAAPMFPEAPAPASVRLVEGGAPGEVVSVESVPAKLHVVVAFDSSFSMRKIFPQARAAALRFVENLPPESTVEFIDFDTKIRDLPAADRAALLAAIREIKADGSTKLYDSILRGLAKCASHRRSALVVFTDGFDGRVDDPGYGSRATEEQVFAAVKNATTPLFTIAYGEKPDEKTLQRLATDSGGAYFRAQAESVESVFDRIRGLVDRDYRITYRRPAKVAPSNTPVVTVVLDVSGSMDMDPSDPSCGHRIEPAKDLLREFFGRLPRGSVVQFITFSGDVDVVQVPTADPDRLLRALAPIVADGFTATLEATQVAHDSLAAIPSRNRYLLFITDAALAVDDDDREHFERLLAGFKQLDVRSLWVGMVEEDNKEPFVHAAALSGGEYVVSPGPESLSRALASLEQRLGQPADAAKELAVEVLIEKPDSRGEPHLYGGNGLFPLPLPPVTETLGVGCLTATLHAQPTGEYAAMPAPAESAAETGTSTNGTAAAPGAPAALEHNRMKLEATARNDAVEIAVAEVRLYSRLHGIEAPVGHRFVELHLTFTDILPAQQVVIPDKGAAHPANWVATGKLKGRTVTAVPPYLIPDVAHHLFLRWNDGTEHPPSPVSVLDPEPLFLPGDPSLLVNPGQPRTGRLVFLVGGENLKQASLHLYDTAYKHCDLPLVGPLAPRPKPLTALPTVATGKLSETFVLHLLGSADSAAPLGGVAPGERHLFRTVQLGFESQVQALLALDPAARFELLLGTAEGPLATPLAPLTDLLPGGLYRPASLAPGSHNRFQQVYFLPAALAAAPAALAVELKGDDLVLPFGPPLPTTRVDVPFDPTDGVAIRVNRFATAAGSEYADRPLLVADITIADAPDGFSTSIAELFHLSRVAVPGGPFEDPIYGPARLKPVQYEGAEQSKGLGGFAGDELINFRPQGVLDDTAARLFGLGPDAVIPDGATRRFILLFNPPTEGEWVLAFHGREQARFAAPAAPLPPEQHWLLVKRPEYPQLNTSGVDAEIAERVGALEVSGHFDRLRREAQPPSPVADERGHLLPAPLAPPRLTAAGEAALATLLAADEATLWRTLGALGRDPVPAHTDPWAAQLGAEAVLTQGHGTPAELAHLARRWFQEHGAKVETLSAELTDKGRADFAKLCPHAPAPDAVPLLRAGDTTWAFPFARCAEELAGCLAREPEPAAPDPARVRITVSVTCRPSGKTAASHMADFSAALGGGESDENTSFTLWDDHLPLGTLSRDPLDLFFFEERGKLAAQLEIADERRTVRSDIDLREWQPVAEAITFHGPGLPNVVFHRDLAGAELDGTYHCLALGAPDLLRDAAAALARTWAAARTAEPPNHRSIVRWLGRQRIATFLAGQTDWERRKAAALGLRLSRADSLRALVFTVAGGADGTMRQSFDLAASEPAPLGPERAAKAFRAMQGLADAALEGGPLGARSVTDLWRKPQNYLLIAPERRAALAEAFSAQPAMPAELRRRLAEGREYLLFAKEPVELAGRPVWGWLEIDPRTCAVRSVLSSGEHGSMVETAINEYVPDAASYSLGFMVGVDASVWSVCSFTLEGLDYAAVMQQAEAFAQELAKRFNNISEDPKIQLGEGVVITREGVKFNDDGESNFRSFVDGYNAGVAYYFGQAGG